jgi:PKD repeat protein
MMLAASLTMMWAQEADRTDYVRCYTVEHEDARRAENPKMWTVEQFENWLEQKIAERRANPHQRTAAYRIPYVLHVIHKGEAIGSGTNLSQAIVDEQFQQINEDFRRENADTTNTPPMFLDVAGAFDVEFVPAVVDPDGNILDEPGIHRVNGVDEFGIGVWSSGEMDGICKPNTIWDPSRYMNVWAADLAGGLLGYAQFPEGSTLPGMPGGSENPATDGVVCLFSSIGGLDLPGTAVPYHLGRTLTHELGHWIGLRHTWGDGDCSVDDFCDDTPDQDGSNFGCPSGSSSCGSVDMPENYMDYSDDACFNIFTMDQVERMITVMENSPRRNELLGSTVWQFPAADTIIAGIDCDVASGCTPLTVSFSDDSFVGDSAVAISSWSWNFDEGGLGGADPAASMDQDPGAVTFSNPGTYTVSLTISNGVYTNTATKEVTVQGTNSLDIIEDFEAGFPADWTNDNWQEGAAGYASSASMYQDNWFNSGRVPAFASTPSLDLDVEATYIELSFYVAHANYSLTGLGAEEGLAIDVSTDCGVTWTEIWRKLDSDDPPFYTSQNTSSTWLPDPGEWREEVINLTAYLGENNVRVRFHGISDWGNDTYIDDVQVRAITVDPDDVIADFEADPAEGCQGLEVLFTDLSVSGSGTDITSWDWNFDLDGVGDVSPATSGDQDPGTVTFNTGGTYTVQLIVSDGVTSDTATATIEVEGSDALPVMVDFESGIPAAYVNNGNWEPAPVGYASGNSMFQDNWNSPNTAELIITAVDLSGPADEATLTFDVAHVYWSGAPFPDEGMAVQYSTDCGATWTEIYRKLDSDDDPFFTVPGGTSSFWTPASDDDWRSEEVDIIGLVGNASVKFRFEGIGAFGNNTYVDNISIMTRVVDENSIEAEFEASAAVICEGQTVDFTDLSLIGTAITNLTYAWDFDDLGVGLTDPSTSSEQNPSGVVFETAGTYTVQLTVSGDGSAGPVSNTVYAEIVVEGSQALPISEDFESGFPPANWSSDMFQSAPVGYQSNTSAFADNYNSAGLRADLTMPSLDFSAVGRAELSFDIAHTFYSGLFGNLYDTLAIAYSIDCGETWTEIWRKDDGDPLNPLYTVPGTGASFVPTSDGDWRAETVDVTFLQGYPNVRIRFENRGNFGNGLFLDNINIDAELVDPDDVFAYFTVEGSAGCVGNAITFNEASTAGANTEITSWEWNFDGTGIGGADPATFTGQNPPDVVFSTAGDYEITLTVSDGAVSDDYTVTLSVGASEDLAFSENFSGSAFPPAGWTNILWEQAAESSDELLGSLFADNYFNVNFKANAWTPPLDMSWYDQITLNFDVAHSRFSTAENEGLVVSGSSDCGASFTEVWSKYDYDAAPLYTVDDLNSAAWFPEGPEDWREEIVDLSSFNDYNAVRIEFFNDGFYGNNTFVDDINISGIIFNPTGLTAEVVTGNDMELNWTDNSEKEAGYEVKRWDPDAGMYMTVAMLDADTETYIDENLAGPMRYYYQVCAYNEMAAACSNEATDSIGSVLLVEGLIAILVDTAGTSIELFWNDISTVEDGFYIKRSTDGVNFTIINTLTADQEYYIDEFLDETTTYYYQVCAFNSEDVAESNIASETTDINAPSNLIATPEFNNMVLTWTDNSNVEDGFQIKRADNSGGPYQTVTVVPTNVTSYTDFVLDENTEYCYIVCAYNDVAVGCSNEACNTTDMANSIFDDLAASIGLYPNPANRFVDIELSGINGEVNIRIYNQLGDVMMVDDLVGGAARRVELTDLAAGIYMVMIHTDDGFTTKKLMVE